MADEDRSRLVRWRDPGVAVDRARGLPGLELLQLMLDGKIDAPVCALVGLRLVAVSEGVVTFQLEPHESQYNLIGCVHGGVVATLLDSAMGCAVHSRLGIGETYATVEINVSYVRAVTPEVGPLRSVGRVVTMGSRIATARADAVDRDGRVYAHGTTVCLLSR